jgi:hypothetical protein
VGVTNSSPTDDGRLDDERKRMNDERVRSGLTAFCHLISPPLPLNAFQNILIQMKVREFQQRNITNTPTSFTFFSCQYAHKSNKHARLIGRNNCFVHYSCILVPFFSPHFSFVHSYLITRLEQVNLSLREDRRTSKSKGIVGRV